MASGGGLHGGRVGLGLCRNRRGCCECRAARGRGGFGFCRSWSDGNWRSRFCQCGRERRGLHWHRRLRGSEFERRGFGSLRRGVFVAAMVVVTTGAGFGCTTVAAVCAGFSTGVRTAGCRYCLRDDRRIRHCRPGRSSRFRHKWLRSPVVGRRCQRRRTLFTRNGSRPARVPRA